MTTTTEPPQTFPENPAVQEGDSVVSQLVNVGIQSGATLLFTTYPVLALPGLKQLVQLSISFFSGYIVKGLQTVVAFTVIDVQVGAEKTAFNDALIALKAAQLKGDPVAIQVALKTLQLAAANLANVTGANS